MGGSDAPNCDHDGGARGKRPPPSAAVPLPAGQYVSDPAWVRTPTSAELAALYPEEARKARKGNGVIADCVISAAGALDPCKIDDELRPGQGFGPATLAALKLFQMAPTTQEGRSVAGLRIALRQAWTPPSPGAAEGPVQTLVLSISSGSSADATSALPPPAPWIIRSPDWTRLPTGDEFADLFPDGARAKGISGEAVIQCKAAPDGALTDCVMLREAPLGLGFGAATLKSARHFRMRPTLADGKTVDGAIVLIPVKWQLQPR
jgi:hypothetical protein